MHSAVKPVYSHDNLLCSSADGMQIQMYPTHINATSITFQLSGLSPPINKSVDASKIKIRTVLL